MCNEWLESFENFHDWAVENGYDYDAPFGECTIDRIDVNGNYEPSNCRWADSKTQSLNKRKNRIITCNGISKPLHAWAIEAGLNDQTIAGRIDSGWEIEKALTLPSGAKGNQFQLQLPGLGVDV